MQLVDNLKLLIRDVHDFPRPGIVFKDITPLLETPQIVNKVVKALASQSKGTKVDAVVAIEARGFLFGFLLAYELGVPFVPVRKEGKLPYRKITQAYTLEYGTAAIEMHEDAIKPGWKVVIHDDLLATGGTANAAGQLVERLGGEVAGFSFIVNLDFLGGFALLRKQFNQEPRYLINY
ncbi:MAG TPA: adenine phosphoribosyltransferase [Cyclobacteriaceae bacterium]